MNLSRALGRTMILLPTASNHPVNLVHLSFSNNGLAPSVPEPRGQANRAVQSLSLGQEWMTICQLPDLGS